MIQVDTQRASAQDHSLALTVTQEGLVVTVEAGGFRYGGEDYTLAEDWTYTVTSDVEKHVLGTLALDGGDVVLGVEEMQADVPEAYNWRAGPYTPLHELFKLIVPEGATTLDAVVVRVTHLGEEA